MPKQQATSRLHTPIVCLRMRTTVSSTDYTFLVLRVCIRLKQQAPARMCADEKGQAGTQKSITSHNKLCVCARRRDARKHGHSSKYVHMFLRNTHRVCMRAYLCCVSVLARITTTQHVSCLAEYFPLCIPQF
jgi:hypothetical protein